MQSTATPMNAKGQGHHLVTFTKEHGLTIFKSFFLETIRLIEVIFNLKPMWDGRKKLFWDSNTKTLFK